METIWQNDKVEKGSLQHGVERQTIFGGKKKDSETKEEAVVKYYKIIGRWLTPSGQGKVYTFLEVQSIATRT